MDQDTQRNIEHELSRLDDDLTRFAADAASVPALHQAIRDLSAIIRILLSSSPMNVPHTGLPMDKRQQIEATLERLDQSVLPK